MKLEVTDKEAQGIFESRHVREKGKKYYIFGTVSFVVGMIVFFLIPSSWLGLVVFCAIIAPAMWWWMRF